MNAKTCRNCLKNFGLDQLFRDSQRTGTYLCGDCGADNHERAGNECDICGRDTEVHHAIDYKEGMLRICEDCVGTSKHHALLIAGLIEPDVIEQLAAENPPVGSHQTEWQRLEREIETPWGCLKVPQAQSVVQSALDTQVGGDHYTNMKIQPAEFILANGLGYAEGSVIKYISRWDKKGTPAEDLKKARHWINILLEELEK